MASSKKAPGAKSKHAVTATEPSAASAGEAAALRHGAEAAGAKSVKPGFAYSPEQDLAFALGWPHMRHLVEGGADDDASLVEAARAIAAPTRTAKIAPRLARLLAFGIYPDGKGGVLLEHEGKKVAPAGPMSEDEARRIVSARMKKKNLQVTENDLVLLLEALVGPEPLTDAIVATLEGFGDDELRKRNDAGRFYAYYVGFGLLRVRAKVAEKQRARLEAVFARGAKEGPTDLPSRSLIQMLDVALHGAAGATRSGDRVGDAIDPYDLLHVTDDPALVRTNVEKQPVDESFTMDARLVFLGGDEVIDVYAKRWSKIKDADEQREIVRTFGEIRSPRVVKLMSALAATSKAKKQAAAWLAAHEKKA